MNGMLAVFAGILAIMFVVSFFPSLQAPFMKTSSAIEDATGQTVDHSAANAAGNALWGILAICVFFAAMTDIGPVRNPFSKPPAGV